MRIVMLSGYSHPSHHRKVELLADAPDVEITHILPPDCGRAPGHYPSASGERRYEIRHLPIRSLGGRGDSHRIYHWPPRFALREIRPQIVHCEHEQEGLLCAEVALARAALAPQSRLILYSWQNILRRRGPAVRMLSAFTLRSADHISCASTEAVEVLRRQGYRGGSSVIPLMGLDTRYFSPKDAGDVRREFGLGGFVAGYAGRLVKEKGLDTLLEAVARVRTPVEVVLVGDGPERAALQQQAQGLGIASRCHFVPAVPIERMADYLHALDLLVLPSLTTSHWKEQFGRVLVEAMGCKVAVAGSDSGAIPEVIGDAGHIFPEGKAEALAAIIEDVANDPEQRRAMAERGYRRALERYSVERLAAEILDVWRRRTARSVAGSPGSAGTQGGAP